MPRDGFESTSSESGSDSASDSDDSRRSLHFLKWGDTSRKSGRAGYCCHLRFAETMYYR